MALFAGRLLLAHNRTLFPYHKWFMREIRSAPDQPADFVELHDAFVATPTIATGKALVNCICNFLDLPTNDPSAGSRFVLHTEREWRHRTGTVQDW